MAITVASWNIRDSIMRASIREKILSLGADIVVLPEAYAEADHDSDRLQRVFEHISHTTPYRVHCALYGDSDGRADRHGMVVLTRRSLYAYVRTICVGRNMVAVTVGELTVLAVHFDDRRDVTRQSQFNRLLAYIAGVRRVAVVGDFNVTHPGTLLGRVLGWLPLGWLPVGEPGRPQSKLARLGSLLTRLREMTSSSLLEELVKMGFTDADRKRRRTMLLFRKVPLAQLDHVLVRGLRVVRFARLRLGGSDHLPIVAELETT